jgi:hypothetical protein
MAASTLSMAQGRADLEDEHWENVPEYPFPVESGIRKVTVSNELLVKSDTVTYLAYVYSLNEQEKPERLKVYNQANGQYVADYIYTYAPGDVVTIVKEKDGVIQYKWKLDVGITTDEARYEKGKLKYFWRYNRTDLSEIALTKETPNGKVIYTWHILYDEEGRVKKAYRVHGNKIAQLLAHTYEEIEDGGTRKKIYHFDNNAMHALEIGLNLERDSIIKMDPSYVASVLTTPMAITEYEYTADNKLARHLLRTQTGTYVNRQNYSYDQEGRISLATVVPLHGPERIERYSYNDDGKRKSVVQIISYSKENVEVLYSYFYDTDKKLTKIKTGSTLSADDWNVMYFAYE